MTSTSSLAQLRAASFDTFQKAVCLLNKGKRPSDGIHRLRKPGILKSYLETDIIVALNFDVPYPPHKFCFVFHRVPPWHENFHSVGLAPCDVRYSQPTNAWVQDKTDCVLVVRHSSKRPNDVAPSLMPVRSAKWLLLGENLPEPWVDFSCGQQAFHVGRIVAPREVNPLALGSRGDVSCRESGLVERVSSSYESFSDFPPEFMRHGLVEDELLDVLTGLSVVIDDNRCRIILEKRSRLDLKFGKCFSSPADRVLRWLEVRANG